MTLIEINTLMVVLLTSIGELLLTPPYFWFTAMFVIGGVIAIISALINLTK